MTIGRSNSALSETRTSVSWKVERAPNSGKNCFGRTSREAGHSRVPAPPHMIRGIMRLSIVISNLGVSPIPGDQLWPPCHRLGYYTGRGVKMAHVAAPVDGVKIAFTRRC